MKIAILTIGTQGDVQPFVALGTGLKDAGHEVTIATGKGFERFVTERRLRHVALDVDIFELMQTPEGKAALAGKNLLGTIRKLMPTLRHVLDEEWLAAQGADAIVYHPKTLGGYHIAEKLDVPAFLSLPVPMYSPTRAFPNPALPVGNLGGLFNKLSYAAFLRLITAPYHRMINRWRRETLRLPPRSFAASDLRLHGWSVRRMYCYSPHVVPNPADWDGSSTATGYWFLEDQDGWRPPAELVEFLASGPPPVYVGFGSMAGRDPEKTTAVVLAALKDSGQRGVLATGWGGISSSDVPDTVFVLGSAPHHWLFPRMAALVHHGGAGTTGVGLRAGKPTIICPFFGDQPFWGRRVAALGVGPKPIPQRRFTADRLAQVIHLATTDDGMQRHAADLGEKIRAEQGVARAVGIINNELA